MNMDVSKYDVDQKSRSEDLANGLAAAVSKVLEAHPSITPQEEGMLAKN
jgi:hypothetical protein